MFSKILIASGGEIAAHVIQACREMRIQTVVVYSETDRDCLHTVLTDEAICIGPTAFTGNYLNIERILAVTVVIKADVIHPGFNFLSENARFAKLRTECNIAFIGPSVEIINKMGSKSEARKTMMETGVPVVLGSKEPVHVAEDGLAMTKEIGFSVMIKTSSDGGGKGMRTSRSPEDFTKLFNAARMKSVKGSSGGAMYIEKYVEKSGHVEFQVIASKHGSVVYLGERDCSIQRRHQKVLEEAPCDMISPSLRKAMGDAAVKATEIAGYESTGTMEFPPDKDKNFYPMEMNVKIQVEHPATEVVTGVGLIKEQVRVATGETLSANQEDVRIEGHATECRISAESLSKNLIPCPGRTTNVHIPGGNGVRMNTHIYNDYKAPTNYDSMLMKLVVYDRDRKAVISRVRSALDEVIIEGIETSVNF